MRLTNKVELKEQIEKRLLLLAIMEDVASGDVTSQATISTEHRGKAIVRTKSNGIVAGLRVAKAVFEIAGKNVVFQNFVEDGDEVKENAILTEIFGFTRDLLMLERIVLNFMQRMSGIATMTRMYVATLSNPNIKILDTRKTAPGLRYFDKEAVILGGGENHRFGLYDRILIKDNHVDSANGVANAIRKAQEYRKIHGLAIDIEVEVRTIDEVKGAVPMKPEYMMFDNFSFLELKQASSYVRSIDKNIKLEVSGGVNLETIARLGTIDIDYISIGALTHSVQAMDISMKIKNES